MNGANRGFLTLSVFLEGLVQGSSGFSAELVPDWVLAKQALFTCLEEFLRYWQLKMCGFRQNGSIADLAFGVTFRSRVLSSIGS